MIISSICMAIADDPALSAKENLIAHLDFHQSWAEARMAFFSELSMGPGMIARC